MRWTAREADPGTYDHGPARSARATRRADLRHVRTRHANVGAVAGRPLSSIASLRLNQGPVLPARPVAAWKMKAHARNAL